MHQKFHPEVGWELLGLHCKLQLLQASQLQECLPLPLQYAQS
jgi:hypothetical protein